jgi:hypothetical protein
MSLRGAPMPRNQMDHSCLSLRASASASQRNQVFGSSHCQSFGWDEIECRNGTDYRIPTRLAGREEHFDPIGLIN